MSTGQNPVVSTNVGSLIQTENVGAKRLNGADLITQGKMPQWVYYIVEVQSLAVYDNESSSNIWFDGRGIAIAGDLATRDSLNPTEGQKFFLLDDNTAYVYAGGAWGGLTQTPNFLSPTVVPLSAASSLTLGRAHIASASFTATVPEQTGDGYRIEFYVAAGSTCTLEASGSNTFTDETGTGKTTITANSATYYILISLGSVWYVFGTGNFMVGANNLSELTNASDARTNLGVYSKQEVDDLVEGTVDGITYGEGLETSGSVPTEDLEVSVDFATQEEANAGTETAKSISPATMLSALEAQNSISRFNNITGLLQREDNPTFSITGGSGNTDFTAIAYPDFSGAFNTDPFVRNDELIVVDYTAAEIVIPSTVDIEVRKLVAHSDGTVELATTEPADEEVNIFLLGTILIQNGEVLDIGGDRFIQTTPWLSSSDFSLRALVPIVTGGAFSVNGVSDATLTRESLTIEDESVNWVNSTTAPHLVTFPESNPAVWALVDRFGNTLTSLVDTEVDGRWYDDGVAPGQTIGNNEYGIQVAILARTGAVAVLASQVIESTFTDAFLNINSYTPTIPASIAGGLELARWVVRGNQYSGSASLDLTDPTNFTSQSGSTVAGGGNTTEASGISADTANSLTQGNVQGQLDELAAYLLPADVGTDTTLTYRSYRFTLDATHTLPDMTGVTAPKKIVFYLTETVTSVLLQVNGSLGENIIFITDSSQSDTSMEFTRAGIRWELVWNGTNWEI